MGKNGDISEIQKKKISHAKKGDQFFLGGGEGVAAIYSTRDGLSQNWEF